MFDFKEFFIIFQMFLYILMFYNTQPINRSMFYVVRFLKYNWSGSQFYLFYKMILNDSRGRHLINSTCPIPSIQSVISRFSPGISPRVLDNPERHFLVKDRVVMNPWRDRTRNYEYAITNYKSNKQYTYI